VDRPFREWAAVSAPEVFRARPIRAALLEPPPRTRVARTQAAATRTGMAGPQAVAPRRTGASRVAAAVLLAVAAQAQERSVCWNLGLFLRSCGSRDCSDPRAVVGSFLLLAGLSIMAMSSLGRVFGTRYSVHRSHGLLLPATLVLGCLACHSDAGRLPTRSGTGGLTSRATGGVSTSTVVTSGGQGGGGGALAGTGGGPTTAAPQGTGGTVGAGGTPGTGGTTSTVGTQSTGGAAGTGGSIRSGGAAGTSAAPSTGGSAGGSAGSPGTVGSGGNQGEGGTGVDAGSCPVELVGWATLDGGTQGGGSAIPQRVTTLADLRALAGDGTARVIEISGTITTGSSPIEIKSNKTLVGVDKNATIKGGLNLSDGTSNVIIRNLNILGVGTSSNSGEPVDTVAARGSHNLWFDHLNLTDGPDGMLDLTKGSDHATVSWCKISYTTSNRDHRLSLLFGAGSTEGETDTGKNNHTVHHNWFAQNVDQRMPRVLFGKTHVFNNFYNSPGNLYCIGSGSFASVLIENNYFKDVKSPHQFADTNHAYIAATGNVYDNTSGNREIGLGGTTGAIVAAWMPSYGYKLDKAEDVPSRVQRCAGPQ
jgi:pectate lyase